MRGNIQHQGPVLVAAEAHAEVEAGAGAFLVERRHWRPRLLCTVVAAKEHESPTGLGDFAWIEHRWCIPPYPLILDR